MIRIALSLVAWIVLGSGAVSAQDDLGEFSLGRSSLQSVNYPGHYVRHANYLGEISEIRTPLDRADSTFEVVHGLNGRVGSISLESINYPGHYLRHQNYRVRLDANDGSALFRDDATFVARSGLGDAGAVSFESVNFPGHFIRHSNFHLWLNANDGSGLFREDATFRVTPPNDRNTMDAQQSFSCYWLEPGQAATWRLMPQFGRREQCYAQDSCDGGLGQSGGGCYKWSAGPYARREPW